MVLKDKKSENQSLLNENIPFSNVLLISERGRENITKQEALNQARELGLDLLCVAPSASPPVCKLIDYKKYIFDLKKERKKKKENVCKEVRFSLQIEENDLKVKLNKIRSFIEKGSTVKVNLVRQGKEKNRKNDKISEEKCQEIIKKIQIESPKTELKEKIYQQSSSFYFYLYKKKQ